MLSEWAAIKDRVEHLKMNDDSQENQSFTL